MCVFLNIIHRITTLDWTRRGWQHGSTWMTHIANVKVLIGDDMVCEVLIGNDMVYDVERHTREANSWINHITHVKVLIGVHVCVSQYHTPYDPLRLD